MAVKRLTRVAKSLVIIGISLALISLVRGGVNYTSTKYFSGPPNVSIVQSYFWVPRDLRLEVNSENPITLSITDPFGAKILKAENVKRDLYILSLNHRGTYTLSIYNPTPNKLEMARFDFTFYGFEKDFVAASIILTLTGIIIIVTQPIYYKLATKTKITRRKDKL